MNKRIHINAFCRTCGDKLTPENRRVDESKGYIYPDCKSCFNNKRPSRAKIQPRVDGGYLYA